MMIEIGELYLTLSGVRRLASLRFHLPARIGTDILRREDGPGGRSPRLCQGETKDLVWKPHRHAGKKEHFAIMGHGEIIVMARHNDLDIVLPKPEAGIIALVAANRRRVQRDRIDRRIALVVGDEIDSRGIGIPGVSSHPTVVAFGQIPDVSAAPVVEHQPEAVALVSRANLRAICYVLSIRRI